MEREHLLRTIKDRLIVSCQARKGWAMYGENIMSAFAKAAEIGGAVAIRATGPGNISAIKKITNLPILGINKLWTEGCDVYITPTFDSAKLIIEAGSSIVALDGTKRKRPNGETLKGIVEKIQDKYPDILIMADCATFEEGLNAEKIGVDLVSTTLCGYTEETKHIHGVNFQLIKKLSAELKVPIIAEGHIHTKYLARKAIENGAYSIVVGTAITRPEIITKWFVEELSSIE